MAGTKHDERLNILMAEDSQDDFELIVRKIRKTYIGVNAIRVDTSADFIKELKGKDWDLILSDNSMPSFNALEALHITRKTNPYVPFIIVSGTIGKKAAVNAIKMGANDFVLKDDLTRLESAIHKEIEDYKISKEANKTKKLLAESRMEFENVFECLSEGILLLDHNGAISRFNPSAMKMLDLENFKIENSLFNIITERFHLQNRNGDAVDQRDFLVKQVLESKNPIHNTVYGLTKRNETKWFSFNCVPFKCGEDPANTVIVSIRDVTSSYQSRRKIDRLAQELFSLIENACAPIFGVDATGNINVWNDYATKITGYEKYDVLSLKLEDELLPESGRLKFRKMLSQTLLCEDMDLIELPLKTVNGKTLRLLCKGSPRRSFKGDVIGMFCVAQDITELIEHQEHLEYKIEERTGELKKALNNHKQIADSKTKFFSMVSHEFRAPLKVISKAIENLDTDRFENKNASLDSIKEQVSHLQYLMEDVLDNSQGEIATLKVKSEKVDLVIFGGNIVRELESVHKSHQIQFQCEQDDCVMTDKNLLRNILVNLLTNAIKFSPGQSKIRLFIQSLNGLLSIEVQDWGLGMKDEDQEKIFEAFYRSKGTSHIEGTGLGLSIVKRAVDVQHGVVTVHSRLDHGTTFKISLPVEKFMDSGVESNITA